MRLTSSRINSPEPTLLPPLGGAGALQLDRAAENVALDFSAQGGHQHLMLSAPHRANLLNPAYNVVGWGMVRSGDRLHIAQDFAHALPETLPARASHAIGSPNLHNFSVGACYARNIYPTSAYWIVLTLN